MGLVSIVLVGLVAGSLAQRVMGLQRQGCLYTLIVGTTGALIGGYLFKAVFNRTLTGFDVGSVFAAFVGACIFCVVLQVIDRGRRRSIR